MSSHLRSDVDGSDASDTRSTRLARLSTSASRVCLCSEHYATQSRADGADTALIIHHHLRNAVCKTAYETRLCYRYDANVTSADGESNNRQTFDTLLIHARMPPCGYATCARLCPPCGLPSLPLPSESPAPSRSLPWFRFFNWRLRHQLRENGRAYTCLPSWHRLSRTRCRACVALRWIIRKSVND
jgi:hypothetical protein